MPPVLLILSEVLQHPLDAALGVGGVGLPFLGLGSGVQDGHGVLGLGAGFHFADIGSGVGWQLWGLGRIAVPGNLSLTDRCDEKLRFFADFEKKGLVPPVLLILSEVLQHPLDAALGVGDVGISFLSLGSGVQPVTEGFGTE